MQNKHINEFMARAGSRLSLAEKELSRPSEDSVTFMVCHTSNNAIREYLVSLIAFNYSLEFPGEDIVLETLKKIENWDIDFLKDIAAKLEPRFENLDISHLNCSSLDKEATRDIYCLSIDTVRKCTELAQEVKQIVTEYINSNPLPKDNSQLNMAFKSYLN